MQAYVDKYAALARQCKLEQNQVHASKSMQQQKDQEAVHFVMGQSLWQLYEVDWQLFC